ncbi:hypothetical protein Emag_000145 [Eimeria magna]
MKLRSLSACAVCLTVASMTVGPLEGALAFQLSFASFSGTRAESEDEVEHASPQELPPPADPSFLQFSCFGCGRRRRPSPPPSPPSPPSPSPAQTKEKARAVSGAGASGKPTEPKSTKGKRLSRRRRKKRPTISPPLSHWLPGDFLRENTLVPLEEYRRAKSGGSGLHVKPESPGENEEAEPLTSLADPGYPSTTPPTSRPPTPQSTATDSTDLEEPGQDDDVSLAIGEDNPPFGASSPSLAGSQFDFDDEASGGQD